MQYGYKNEEEASEIVVGSFSLSMHSVTLMTSYLFLGDDSTILLLVLLFTVPVYLRHQKTESDSNVNVRGGYNFPISFASLG